MNAQISRLALVALILLGSLVAATTYWQAWAAGSLAAKQDNEIQRVAQFRIRRGLIYAADGKTVLAANRAVKRGGQTLYFRRYPTHGFASQTIGYSTQGRSRAGIATILGFQAFLIVGGVTRVIPLTGITLPFVSYGGSSLVANFALLAILLRISDDNARERDPELAR